VKLFVLDSHTIHRRGLVACLDLLESVELVDGALPAASEARC
jgi:hypothetical protein